MIIKSIDINAFGVIKDYHLQFTKGINLIYGENEAGKSTIQNFIKVWLYGFSNYRGKNLMYNERLKYLPLSGEKIKGILTFEIDEREYMIIRSFGKSKKDDEIKVIDSLSGENLSNIYGDEPGKKILGVTRSTFIKTLFIGQLAVEVKGDKDDKIIDKIVNFTGSNQDEPNVQKSFEKINQYIKSITNIRRNGTLDIAREKRGSLELEKIEYYKIHETNLEQEENLIKLKKKKSLLKTNSDNILKYKQYLKVEELKNKYNRFKDIDLEFHKYKDTINQLQKEINNLNYKKENLKKDIANLTIIESLDSNIKETFIIYEGKLNEIKNIYSDIQVLNSKKKYLVLFILLINLLMIISFKSKIIIIALDICIPIYYIYDKFLNKESPKYKFYKTSQEITGLEKNLDNIKENIGAKDYSDLFKKLNLFYKYKDYIQNIEEDITKKNEEIALLKLKLQTIKNTENIDEKIYLERKINEIKLEDNTLSDEKSLKSFNESINLKDNFYNLTFLEKEERIESEINNNTTEIINCEKEIINLENSIKSSFYGKRPLAELEEDITNVDAIIDDLKKKLKAGELAQDMMKKAYVEIRDDFNPQLNNKLLKKYNTICNKNYDNILISDEYEINLLKDTSILDYRLLSNGSKDQLFLSLRLSFIEIIFKKNNVPLFLDDAFVQYDDKKLKNTLTFLLKEEFEQQFIFTCQNREKKILEEVKSQFNYIELP